jgi:hypothetical protein
MKEVEVYVKKEFVEELKKNYLLFMEFNSRLYGIFGNWRRMTVFEPFVGKSVLYGINIVKYKIPSKLGMLIGIKKLCLAYGAENLIFSEKENEFEDYVNWNIIMKKLFEEFKDYN